MKAEFSEFTYGLSLVNELTKTLTCTAVPIFPSLIEEGKKGGGYDAKLLSKRGTILNLQFKLSDWMKGSNAREHRISGIVSRCPTTGSLSRAHGFRNNTRCYSSWKIFNH